MLKLVNKVEVALRFATLFHDGIGQRYGDFSYGAHLQDVMNVLLRFDVTDKDILAAACLHDLMEDVNVSKNTISELFGNRVADLVDAVTDAPGANRKERKAATYPKIKAAGTDAIVIKLADRIANVEHSISAKNIRTWKMYRKEHSEFCQQLRSFQDAFGLETRMWQTLDRLFDQEPAPVPRPPIAPEV